MRTAVARNQPFPRLHFFEALNSAMTAVPLHAKDEDVKASKETPSGLRVGHVFPRQPFGFLDDARRRDGSDHDAGVQLPDELHNVDRRL